MKRFFKVLSLFALVSVITGCATNQNEGYDYTAFKESNPSSILVLPPTNQSVEVLATDSVFAQVTRPLAESGYYVFPVGLVHETFKSNGMTEANDIQQISLDKLNEIFNPDTVLYLDITDYGTQYQVIQSNSRVTVNGKLVDASNGRLLWEGSATASSAESSNTSSNLFVMLASALIQQVFDTSTNRSHSIAQISNYRLLSANIPNGILHGPRSPYYWNKTNP